MRNEVISYQNKSNISFLVRQHNWILLP